MRPYHRTAGPRGAYRVILHALSRYSGARILLPALAGWGVLFRKGTFYMTKGGFPDGRAAQRSLGWARAGLRRSALRVCRPDAGQWMREAIAGGLVRGEWLGVLRVVFWERGWGELVVESGLSDGYEAFVRTTAMWHLYLPIHLYSPLCAASADLPSVSPLRRIHIPRPPRPDRQQRRAIDHRDQSLRSTGRLPNSPNDPPQTSTSQ
jgi:hypothetical protein